MPNSTKPISWTLVIVCLIIFWPAGMFLLVKKFATDRAATISIPRNTPLTIVGWGLSIFGGVGLITELTREADAFGICFAMALLVGGALILLQLRKIKKQGQKYKKYINIIVNSEERDIPDMARAFGISYDEARKTIQEMVEKGYFPGAYIHEADRKIVMPDCDDIDDVEMRAVTCRSCGARNRVAVGKVGECEYCGSSIRWDVG